MGSRTWIKIYCDKWLSGTLRDEQPIHRGIWIDLLALAGSGRYGDTGEIKLSDGVGLTDTQIAAILKIPLKLWLEAKTRFIDTERISIVEDNNIVITNWQKYQSEYERQKTFRGKSYTEELQPEVTTESYGEKEKEKEKEKIKEEKRKIDVEKINLLLEKKKLTNDDVKYLDAIKMPELHQSLWVIVRALRGECEASGPNKKRYRAELKKMGINA